MIRSSIHVDQTCMILRLLVKYKTTCEELETVKQDVPCFLEKCIQFWLAEMIVIASGKQSAIRGQLDPTSCLNLEKIAKLLSEQFHAHKISSLKVASLYCSNCLNLT